MGTLKNFYTSKYYLLQDFLRQLAKNSAILAGEK